MICKIIIFDGGIDRKKDNDFKLVEDSVAYTISKDNLTKAIEHVKDNIIIGYLNDGADIKIDFKEQRAKSLIAIEQYKKNVDIFFQKLIGSEVTFDSFMDFVSL